MGLPTSEALLTNNLPFMASLPNLFFDLAIVDGPYGLGIDGFDTSNSNGTKGSFYEKKGWDKEPPPPEFFEHLFRVSKNQIIWGANHFINRIPEEKRQSPCWLVWDKNRGDQCFADAELAWTSFDSVTKLRRITWDGFRQDNMKQKERRIHPTQKPVALYNWCFTEYAYQGQKVFDPHMGSQSSRISAFRLGLEYWGCELDPGYYAEGCDRFNDESKILALDGFGLTLKPPPPTQAQLF